MKIGNFELKRVKSDRNQPNLSENAPKNATSSVFGPNDGPWIGQPAWNDQNEDVDILMDNLIATQCYQNSCGVDASRKEKGKYSIEYLVNNLPSITTVANMYTQLIVGGGLIADSKEGNDKLQKWLKQKPVTGMTHQEIITDAIEHSVIYGYTGLRDLTHGLGIIPVHPQYFKIWKLPRLINGRPIPGVKDEFLYEVWKEKKELADKDSQIEINGQRYSLGEVVKMQEWKKGPDGSFYIDDEKGGASATTVYIPKKNFCHLRHNLIGDYGESILARDRLRLEMMADLIINMTDEINNDGNDYIMWLKEQNIVGSSLAQMLSPNMANTAATGGMDAKAKKTAVDKKMDSARKLAIQMKRSNKTRVAVIRKDIVDDFSRIDGTVRLIDYYPFLGDATTIIANAFGLHPILAGSTSSGWNTSMSSVIQFTMERVIVPYQRMYASQLESYVQRATGIKSNIHFKEYDLSDKKTIAEIEESISRTKLNLAKEQEVLNSIKIMKKEANNASKSGDTDK